MFCYLDSSTSHVSSAKWPWFNVNLKIISPRIFKIQRKQLLAQDLDLLDHDLVSWRTQKFSLLGVTPVIWKYLELKRLGHGAIFSRSCNVLLLHEEKYVQHFKTLCVESSTLFLVWLLLLRQPRQLLWRFCWTKKKVKNVGLSMVHEQILSGLFYTLSRTKAGKQGIQ